MKKVLITGAGSGLGKGTAIGNYRNVWPPATEELIKQVQQDAWTRQVVSE
ncbi:hypothetical protein ACWCW7_12695 [Nocardia tengchongensis]